MKKFFMMVVMVILLCGCAESGENMVREATYEELDAYYENEDFSRTNTTINGKHIIVKKFEDGTNFVMVIDEKGAVEDKYYDVLYPNRIGMYKEVRRVRE